jgi:predicted Rossmann fold flavoprotein
VVTSRRTITSAKVVVTTGGQSYPGCGTTGDGYEWLSRLGHTIATPRPALVPVTIRADWAKSLRGITIPDVVVGVLESVSGEKSQAAPRRAALANRRGSLLFAHFGLSGPAVLDVSRFVTLHPRPRSLCLACDFLPKIKSESLADQLVGWTKTDGKKQISGLLSDLLPRRLIESLLVQAGLPADRRAAELTRQERVAVVSILKQVQVPVTGTSGFKKAEVTTGGVVLDEVDSRTMQSKRVANLFLAGEILDLDGPIGGYNFQAAFSTGWLAGENV